MKLKSYEVNIQVEEDEDRIRYMDIIIEKWKAQYPLAKNIMYVILDGIVVMSYEDHGEDEDPRGEIAGIHFEDEE